MYDSTFLRFALPTVALAAVSLASVAELDAQARPNGAADAGPVPRMTWDPNDPRIDLMPGLEDAGEAIWNLDKIATVWKPEGFAAPEGTEGSGYNNTDLAFEGDLLFQGNYHGYQVYDISDPASPELRVSVICPGGQGDVSVFGDLLVMSVQETRARMDCGTQGVQDSVSTERIRGVRIFDISDVENPQQVAAVQTCRGSHTHTLVTDPGDPDNLYVYVQGTSRVRSPSELPGCSGAEPEEDPNTALFRIEVIRVPVDAPEDAEIVNMPRIFADAETGEIAGLWAGGDHGPGTQSTRRTHQCHDITAYPAIGLAGGACSGNGILLDITDPANPIRVDEVSDPNFAYWHSATFNNDGTTVLFTDEWGGGSAPRCRATDPDTWGANAIFRRTETGEMELAGYYKLPVPQTELENCVAHNGSLIPVPGRDIMVQAWYQGGVSLLDFTDPANPYEIAYFDRGPVSATDRVTGGYWSTYWYDGRIYGAEISRGIDVFRLQPSEHLTEAEIAAAELVEMGRFNAQLQPRFEWPAEAPVAHAYLDQLMRGEGILDARAVTVANVLERAEQGRAESAELLRVAGLLEDDAVRVETAQLGGDSVRLRKLAGVLRGMAG